jgi:penicillin amidase
MLLRCRPLLGAASPALFVMVGWAAQGCESVHDSRPPGVAASGADAGAGGDGAAPGSPVESVPLGDTIQAKSLTAPVDLVRDEWGNPHIYGKTFPDVAFAQGWVMAHDRFTFMDFARHQASGTLSEIVGELSPGVIDSDIQMRAHHLRKTAQDGWDQLKASTDPEDQLLVTGLGQFAAGVNAFLDDLRAGKYAPLAEAIALYDPTAAKPWTEVDSLVLGQLQSFSLSFDADSEIHRTQVETRAKAIFDAATDPALLARKGIADDLEILTPVDPTYTIPGGWTGSDGTQASLFRTPASGGNFAALLEADRKSVAGLGIDHLVYPSYGSNNWIVGPSLSSNGHVMVANDTHLALSNPPTFYLQHLVASGGPAPMNVMGVEFSGIPGVVLGMNEHIAWGATVNDIDVTDVYQETVVACDGSTDPCVEFNGSKVRLLPRVETLDIGSNNKISSTKTVTLYDVPHHGPIIPRVTASHDVEPLAGMELSVRYTGYEPAQLFRAAYGVDIAKTMKDAVAALDRDFRYGGQNWVIGDDQGNYGWTETIRVPRRAAGAAPWKVLPGGGTAEWGKDMDPKYIPHAYNPVQGFIATANNDPIGVTDDGDPFFDEPVVDGAPLYLGADYDPGTRVGRITKRINLGTAGGKKLSLDDLQSIQADATNEWGEKLAPTFLDAARALADEIATPGLHADLSTIAASASVLAKGALDPAIAAVAGWTFDTPSGVAEDNPTPAQVADSRATTVMAEWIGQFVQAALKDEIDKLGTSVGDGPQAKLLVRMCEHPELLKSGISPVTHDSNLFDDLTTTAVVESKRQIAGKAVAAALDYLARTLGADATTWRWGNLHTLTLNFIAPLTALQIPLPSDPMYPHGFPRHGDNGTVDVGPYGLSTTSFGYTAGPAIRFVCELDPTGPKGRNVLPGGEILDTASPHYRDQLELWRKNRTYDLAFKDADVVASAQREFAKNAIGRIRFTP